MTAPHLFGLLPDEIAAHLRSEGVAVREDEALRVMAHAVSPTGANDAMKRPLSMALKADIARVFDGSRLEVVERVEDPADGFVKYLFRSPDDAVHEAVRIPLEKPGRFTVCLSSQVGCAMQCVFCATGRLGLARNLAAWEIVAALAHVRSEAPGRVTGAVFMGQGEPLHNYDEVIRAARVLSHPCGGRLRAENIAISTVGLVPQMRRYTREGHPYRLVVSLTSAIESKRKSLLPVAGRTSIEEVASAIRDHALATGDRITIAWVLMGGVNDGADEVEALRALLDGVPVRINLIDVNDARPNGFRRSTDEERGRLRDLLQVLKAPVVRRYSGGASRDAACGMLAATRHV